MLKCTVLHVSWLGQDKTHYLKSRHDKTHYLKSRHDKTHYLSSDYALNSNSSCDISRVDTCGHVGHVIYITVRAPACAHM